MNRSDHVRGFESAKVTVIEYGDFECATCGQAYHAVKILLEHFGYNLRFVFRHFPLRQAHPHAEPAAEVAEIAGAQNKFWLMHDLLFENQSHLEEKNLRHCAAKAELDLVRYDREMKDRLYLQRVQEHIASGIQSKVRSTPAFFVNSVLQDVSFGLEALQRAIETELGAVSERTPRR